MSNEWRRQASVIAGLSVICFVIYGATMSSLGLFLAPIQDELGWTSERVSQLVSLFLIAQSGSSLFTGWLLDRVGARWIMSIGVLLAGAGLVWAGETSSRGSMLLGFAVSGAGMGAATFVPAIWIAGARLRQQLGLVIGIFLAAASVGSALLPPAVGYAIGSLGWRMTLEGAGWFVIASCLPVVLACVPRVNLAPRERSESLSEAGRPGLMRTILSKPFLSLNVMQALFSAGFMGLYFFLVPFLSDSGFSSESTGTIFGLVNAVSAIGLLAIGWLADRISPHLILIINLLLNGMSIFLLMFVGGPSSHMAALYGFVLIWGMTQGAPTQLAPVLLARMSDARDFGTLNGICSVVRGAATAAGPMLIGIVHDQSGTYLTSFYLGAYLVLLAAVVSSFIRPPSSKTAPHENP